MNIGPQIVGLLVSSWVVLALVPFVVFAHSEYQGIHVGWIHASLHPGDLLHTWTLRRLEMWAVLYVLGTLLLWRARRWDPEASHLASFALSLEARLGMGTAALLFLVFLAVAPPADCALYLVASLTALFGLWAWSTSAEAMRLRTRQLLAAGSSIVICLAIGEGVFRLPGVVARTGGSLEARDELWGQTDFRRLTQSNSLQLRSRHIGEPKSARTRILAVGDSFTAGDWVDTIDDTWPGALEAELIARQLDVEVINAGLGGSDTEVQAKYLDDVGWMFAPDVVVLQYTLNDTGGGNVAALPLVPVLDSSLKRKSHLYSWLNQKFRAAQVRFSTPDELSRYFADDFEAWRRSRAAIQRVAQQARERGVPMLFVVYPWLSNELDDGDYPYAAIHAKLARVAADLGVPYLDLRSTLAAKSPHGADWWARPFDSHPSAAANRLAAQAIADRLIADGALPH